MHVAKSCKEVWALPMYSDANWWKTWCTYSGSFLNLKTNSRQHDDRSIVDNILPRHGQYSVTTIKRHTNGTTAIVEVFLKQIHDRLHDCILSWRVACWIIPCITIFWSPVILQDLVIILCVFLLWDMCVAWSEYDCLVRFLWASALMQIITWQPTGHAKTYSRTDLMFWDESLASHLCLYTGTCKDEFATWLVLHCLQPRRVAVNMVQYHDVLVVKARSYCWEKSSVICIHEGFYLVFRDENIILFFGQGSVVSVSMVGLATFVDWTPWRWPCMCPFWVSSDSGKYFATFFSLMSGQERYFPLQIALSQEAFVGKPATPWRYQIVGSTLGSLCTLFRYSWQWFLHICSATCLWAS